MNLFICIYIILTVISIICFLCLCTKYGFYIQNMSINNFISILILNIIWPITWLFIFSCWVYFEINLLKEYIKERKDV